MIDKSTLTLAVETISWQECERLVAECNGNNRPISATHVARLARDARAQRWPLTHQGIAFDHAGHVIDGQHRLAAHAKAQRDFTTVVCRYKSASAAEEAMLIIDGGRPRKVADSLTVGGVIKKDIARDAVAVCVLMDMILSDSTASLHGDGRFYFGDFYRAHRECIDWAVSAAPGKRFNAPMRTAFAIGWKIDQGKTSEFVAQIREGAASPGTAAALWLRAWTDGTLGKGSGTQQERRETCLRALRIIKAHVTGEKVPEKLYAAEDAARWARAQILGSQGRASAAEKIEQSDTVPVKICKVLKRGGAWSVADLATEIGAARDYVANTASQLVHLGQARRVGRGLYMALEAA